MSKDLIKDYWLTEQEAVLLIKTDLSGFLNEFNPNQLCVPGLGRRRGGVGGLQGCGAGRRAGASALLGCLPRPPGGFAGGTPGLAGGGARLLPRTS